MMDEVNLESKLNELVREIGSMPLPQRNKLITLAKGSRKSQKELKKPPNYLEESLDYLRISVKYLLFDLEATRRENEYLRKILEESG